MSFLLFGGSWKLFSEAPQNAYVRILNPKIEYEIPTPFMLNSITKNQYVLGGDTTQIILEGFGDLPDSIAIFMQNKDEIVMNNSSLINHQLIIN